MKTRISLSVAVLALVAATGCDSGSQDSLGNGRVSADRLPQRGATDGTGGTDPDTTGNAAANAPAANAAATGAPATGTTTVPNPGTGTGTGTGTGAGTGAGAATGSTAVLNTFSKVWVSGDDRGPAKLAKNTGAGTMDASFAWNEQLFAADKSKVALGTVYTRSANQPNGDGSYMQGGFALSTLTAQGVQPGPTVDLPVLDGERTFMRPQIALLADGKRVLLIAASEDNGVNNNPQPVAFLADTATGALIPIANSTRGKNINKPSNIIQTALGQNINVNNPNNQRGPHTIALDPNKPDTFLVGMQYNNQAQEAFSITVAADNSLKVNWLQRYSNTAQHCRPQVVTQAGSNIGYVAAVEANNQPADIGFRITKIDTGTGKAIDSKVVVKSQPNQNKYVSEPVIGLLGPDKLAVTYGLAAKARDNNNGNGHAGGKKIDAAVLVNTADLSVLGDPALGVGQYGRHGSSFVSAFGPNGDPAVAVISGSSTGTGAGFIQMYPLKTDGTLGVKDPMKVYQVAAFSDVANVQTRGKRNPNNQGRGFINGRGSVPNPGYTTDAAKAATSFMPDVKSFSFSTVTGYSGPDALAKGLKDSIWLSLVPASWTQGLQTVPGTATDKPGIAPDGLGPAPRTTGPATNPSGDAVSGGGGTDVIPGGDGAATHPSTTARDASAATAQAGGCSTSPGSSSSGSGFGLIGLALAGVLAAIRRKREEA